MVLSVGIPDLRNQYLCKYVYAWNSCCGGLKPQNKGQPGSRYTYIRVHISWRFILQEILSGFGFIVISVVSGFWFGFSPWNPPKETHSNSHSSSWTRWFSSPSLPLLGWKVLELDAVHAQRLFHGRYTYGCTMATSRTPWDSTNEIFIAPSASRYGWHCKTTILALLLHQQTNLYHHMNFGANSEKLFPLAMS